ncbi:hypothetical protein [Clostridioides difficile]|uniref:hypothetical protein n=1 Tax=Clostridioides difficile TaxID=1496 RepID=UPI00038C6C1A|nr:hypothetical protein [Clostridioides difficile]EQG83238.1 hypothetical protein QKC_1200 [Clostridioides difficile DA00167]
MSNNLQIFKNNDFGEIRTVEIDGKLYFVATDIARCLVIKIQLMQLNNIVSGW